MDKLIDHPISVVIIIVVLIIIFYLIAIPPKKLCKHCKNTKTRNKKGICDECNNKIMLEKAKLTNTQEWKCPIHGTQMDIRIVDVNNVIIHECSSPGCNIIALDEETLQNITFWKFEAYPPR